MCAQFTVNCRSEFEHRNPRIAGREVINPERPDESVVSQFVAKQQEEMKRGAFGDQHPQHGGAGNADTLLMQAGPRSKRTVLQSAG